VILRRGDELGDDRVQPHRLASSSLDRIYVHAYVPFLQSSGEVVAVQGRPGPPDPLAPRSARRSGQRFRLAVASFAEANRHSVGQVLYAAGSGRLLGVRRC